MTIEQQQSLNNDLNASALAAAESGVEDGKRIILKYMSMPNGAAKNALLAAMTSSSCNALLSDPTVNSIGISSAGTVTGEPNQNEYYTCMGINLFTSDYESSSPAGQSDFIPLRSQNGTPYDEISISWDLVSATVGADGDGQPSNYAISTLLPPLAGGAQSWSSENYPPYLRAEIYGYPNGNFSRSDISDRTRMALLVPSVVGTTGSTAISFDTIDPLPHQFYQANKLYVQPIQCLDTPATVPIGTYACQALLKLPTGFPSSSTSYYLRLTPIYGASHYKVQLLDSSNGNVINFDEVQPTIDVTGKTNDVFRRVQARVSLGSGLTLPEFGVESAGDICKNMQVTDGSYFQPNNCP